MISELTKVNRSKKEIQVSGYIRNNFLNSKRLLHITGIKNQLAFKIKQIEISNDPCPMKLGKREKDRVMGTSRAQSIVSSRNASRAASKKGSRKGSLDMADEESGLPAKKAVARTKGGKIINQLEEGEKVDDNQIEQVPDPFGAEQTYISEEELMNAMKNN
mmetsp:Transcript_35871/g.55050  ORF Transcript_35871/g.55050 Transcript_35871/m.55050 type:complete len:161 (-) Transcript_35871:1270-1752(-)